MKQTSSTDMPPLARIAGAWLLAASLFAVSAIIAFGVYGRGAVAAWLFVVASVVCLALWLVGRKQSQQYIESVPLDAAAKNRALLGLNAISSVLLVGVLLVGINYIAARRHKTFDLTKNRINSLSEQTDKALAALPRPVRLTYFYVNQPNATQQSLLDSYRRASEKIKVDYINAVTTPVGLPRAFSGQPMLIAHIESAAPKSEQKVAADASTTQEVSSIDEQSVTSALLKLANPKSAKIYFLTGHGEVTPEQIGGASNALAGQNYSLATLSLLQKNAKVPPDAAALVVAAPQVDLSEDEAKTLALYVNTKGRLVVLLSPLRSNAKLPRWNALFNSVGVQMGQGFVTDPQQQNPQLPVGVLSDRSAHPVLAGTSGSVVFPGAVPLSAVLSVPPGVKFTPLFESSAHSSSESGKGPFVLAAATQKGNSRVFVSASTLMLTDQFLSLLGDRSFWLAGVNWTVGNEALVSIPPKPATTNTITMPTPTSRFITLWSLLAMPFLALLAGTVVWWLRR